MYAPLSPEIEQQNRRIRALIAQMSHAEAGESLDSLVKELGEAKRRLAEMMRTGAPAASPVAEAPRKAVGAMLGPETTGLKVNPPHIKLKPVPTGIYNLLNPETDPLLTVTITNLTNDPRRLCVTSYIEGISTRDEKTVEFGREIKKATTILLRPTLLPDQAPRITETQWAMLHVEVEIFGSKSYRRTADARPNLVEPPSNRATLTPFYSSLVIPASTRLETETGIRQDLTRYYAAWVTPHAEPVRPSFAARQIGARPPDRGLSRPSKSRPPPRRSATCSRLSRQRGSATWTR